MRTQYLKKKHNRALFWIDMYEQAQELLVNTEKRITVEDSKPAMKAYWFVSREILLARRNYYFNLLVFIEKRYETINFL